jgi:hypothetical protein
LWRGSVQLLHLYLVLHCKHQRSAPHEGCREATAPA